MIIQDLTLITRCGYSGAYTSSVFAAPEDVMIANPRSLKIS